MLDVVDLVLALLDFGASKANVNFANRTSRWFRKQISKSWPTAQTTVLSARIDTSQGFYTVLAPYSFYADGVRYGGRYECPFANESDAKDTIERLLGSPPLARYKPGHPDKSVIEES